MSQPVLPSDLLNLMAYFHITSSGAVNLEKNRIRKVLITVNAALTGTITISDETGTGGTPVIGIITNPTVGTPYTYYNLKTGLTVNPSATCEITVNTDGSNGPN